MEMSMENSYHLENEQLDPEHQQYIDVFLLDAAIFHEELSRVFTQISCSFLGDDRLLGW